MPSPHSSSATQADARTIAANLGCELIEIPIEPMMGGYERALAGYLNPGETPAVGEEAPPRDPARPSEPDLAAENIQARIRGNLMMALSNRHGWLVLTTGNKSEMSVGYATLYGDMAGGFAVIKDVPKALVYELTRRRNERAGSELVPASVIDRAPSAELRPDQLDSDSLPPYDLLDRILEAYVERDQGREEMIAAGMPAATVDDVIRPGRPLRVQAPPGGAGDPDHAAGLRQGPAAADHQPFRRLALRQRSDRRSLICARRAELAVVVEDFGVPDPGGAAAVAGLALTSAPPSVTGRMKLTLIDWPIAIIPSSITASAVAREQMLSTRVDITPPWRRPTGWRSSSRSSMPDPGVVRIVVEPLGADQRVEVGVQPAGVVSHRGQPYRRRD